MLNRVLTVPARDCRYESTELLSTAYVYWVHVLNAGVYDGDDDRDDQTLFVVEKNSFRSLCQSVRDLSSNAAAQICWVRGHCKGINW